VCLPEVMATTRTFGSFSLLSEEFPQTVESKD